MYQPLDSFPAVERDAWAAAAEEDKEVEGPQRGWLLSGSLPSVAPLPLEGAFVRQAEGGMLVCPWRTRLRMLVGLLAFRTSVPEEVAEAFVPEADARRAAQALARLEEERPDVRSHIVHANWHVPLRWFAAFDDAERILTEDRHGLRVRYETPLSLARTRLAKTLGILEESWIDDGVTDAVRELAGWLGEFGREGLLELDYGSVAGIFTHDELLEDHSAADIWVCLGSLETGDVVRAGRMFAELTERWTEVRAREVVN